MTCKHGSPWLPPGGLDTCPPPSPAARETPAAVYFNSTLTSSQRLELDAHRPRQHQSAQDTASRAGGVGTRPRTRSRGGAR